MLYAFLSRNVVFSWGLSVDAGCATHHGLCADAGYPVLESGLEVVVSGPDILSFLSLGVAHCAAVVSGHSGLMTGLFLAGLGGGLTHCVGMCGPFVLSQVASGLEHVPASRMREWHRLTGAALLPYHLGRSTTYSALGATGAGLVGHLSRLPVLEWVSAALLAMAGVLFLGQALPRLRLSLPTSAGSLFTGSLFGIFDVLFAAPQGWRGYVLGVVLGFIPCGLLYAALAAAASSADPVIGAAGMLLFAMGTVPGLFVTGLAGYFAGVRWKRAMQACVPVLMTVNALVLFWLAFRALFAGDAPPL